MRLVSNTYQPIDNNQLMDGVEAAAQSVLGDNHRITVLPGPQGQIIKLRSTDTIGLGEVAPQIYVRNFNTGHHALKIGCGFFRLVCNNGLMIPEEDAYTARVIHRKGQAVDEFLQTYKDRMIAALNNSIVKFAEFKEDLQSISLTDDQAIELIAHLPSVKKAKRAVLEMWLDQRLRRPEDRGNTAYELYNLINEWDRKYSGTFTALERERTRVSDIKLLTQELAA